MTAPIGVDAPVVGTAAAVEAAGAGTMAGTAAGAATPICTTVGPGADDASLGAGVGFAVRGAETAALMAQLTTVRDLFAATMASSGVAYEATDALNQAALII
ncbi:MAG: PE domain-containing protein [Mycobacterium sp.]|nr:PE domain-containing protein [Mycobacterium sp.]MBV9722487.1 PE domain-containing protein [Mycobacterium sp.]